VTDTLFTLPSFASQTVTVLRPLTVNDHGDITPDWSQEPVTHLLTGCSVQPPRLPRTAVTSGGHEVFTDLVLYGPANADLQDTDRVVFDGDVYAVTGAVHRYETGVIDHIEVFLHRITPVA